MANENQDVEVISSDITSNTMVRRYLLTINNESRSDKELFDYISNLEHIKYFIFQREKGHITGTEHIQAFIVFNVGKRFNTVKGYFPSAHIEKCKGTNSQCRDYCSKSDTRIGEPLEFGKFADERQRTDYEDFLECIQNDVPESQLAKLFPHLFTQYCSSLEKIRESFRHEKLSNDFRKVDCVYIYGAPGVGKTFSVVNKYEQKNVHLVRLYRNGMFDSYRGQDVICFDEFNSQIKITEMNALMDSYALELPARFYNRQANYTKLYIISNLPLSSLYVEEQENAPLIYKAFLRRISTIIRFDEQGVKHFEKCPDGTDCIGYFNKLGENANE